MSATGQRGTSGYDVALRPTDLDDIRRYIVAISDAEGDSQGVNLGDTPVVLHTDEGSHMVGYLRDEEGGGWGLMVPGSAAP